MNDNNDNGRFTTSTYTTTNSTLVNTRIPTPDSSTTTVNKAERDLVPFELRATGASAPGNYKLSFDDSVKTQHIKIWTSPDKSAKSLASINVVGEASVKSLTRIGPDVVFDSSKETTLYIEGVSATSVRDLVTLMWKSPTGNYQKADTMPVTVYSLSGPQYVPGKSTYSYTTSILGGASKPSWAVSGDTSATNSGGVETVTWSKGPAVAEIDYMPNADFGVRRYIYVVGITATAGSATPSAGKAATVTIPANAGASYQVSPNVAANQDDTTKITVSGPSDPLGAGVQRGPQYMQIGQVQNVVITSLRGHYSDGSTLNSVMEGKLYNDRNYKIKDPGPFEDVSNSNSSYVYWEPNYPSAPTTGNSKDFHESDGPGFGVPLFSGTATLLSDQATADFQDCIAVTSEEAVKPLAKPLGGNKYFAFAQFKWHVDLSGVVNKNKFVPSATNSLTGDSKFALLDNAILLPLSDIKDAAVTDLIQYMFEPLK